MAHHLHKPPTNHQTRTSPTHPLSNQPSPHNKTHSHTSLAHQMVTISGKLIQQMEHHQTSAHHHKRRSCISILASRWEITEQSSTEGWIPTWNSTHTPSNKMQLGSKLDQATPYSLLTQERKDTIEKQRQRHIWMGRDNEFKRAIGSSPYDARAAKASSASK